MLTRIALDKGRAVSGFFAGSVMASGVVGYRVRDRLN